MSKRKITDIIITDALGCYGNAARHIVESRGYRCWILDENDNRRGEVDFLNYESALNTPDNFAIWSLSDRATRILLSNETYKSKALCTFINDIEEYTDKSNYGKIFPKLAQIHYPKVHVIRWNSDVIIKPIKGSGTSIENGRAKLVHKDEPIGCFEYIPHNKEQVVLARFEDGKLVETCFYQGMVTEPWSKAKPDDVIVTDSQKASILHMLRDLGDMYDINGIIDAEFMIDNNGSMWFSESNPRQNGQSYFIAKPMIYKFLEREITRLENL